MNGSFDQIHACCTPDPRYISLPRGFATEEAIALNGKLWQPGDTITIGFLDGSPTQQKKAQRWIEYWNQAANLKFVFGAGRPAVRITFRPGGSWSLIGTDCLQVPANQPTIQFGWVTDSSDDTSDRAVIVHEAGHMLGLGHEQSSPRCDIQWNKPLALAYYMRTQGWTADMVEQNVFQVYSDKEVTGTSYDRSSIMQYPVPADLTLDGTGIGWNSDLSPLDRQYVSSIYPGPGGAPPPTPTTPDRPLPVHPVIQIGAPAIYAPIPAPGHPALFTLVITTPGQYRLGVAIVPAFGRDPVVHVSHEETNQTFRLGLAHGAGVFQFAAGTYTFLIANALPRYTGTAWIKVSQA